MSFYRQEFANAILVTAIVSLLFSRPTVAAKIKCYQCTNRNQQCYESFACEGDYCVSQYSVRNNQLYFTKYCENAAPDGVPVKFRCRGEAEGAQETCYCNDKDFCNSTLSHHSTALRFFVLLTSFLCTLTVVRHAWL